MKIAVDLDNTLADTTSVLLRLTNFKFGTNYTLADIQWDFWRSKGPDYDAAFWEIYKMFDSPEQGGINLRRALPPVDPLAPGIVKSLIKRGHDVHILTANRPEAKDSIEAWLFGHGLEMYVELIGQVSPVEKVKLDYDLFIDDSPKIVPAMASAPEKTLIWLSQRGEKVDISGENVWMVENWRGIQRMLESMGLL